MENLSCPTHLTISLFVRLQHRDGRARMGDGRGEQRACTVLYCNCTVVHDFFCISRSNYFASPIATSHITMYTHTPIIWPCRATPHATPRHGPKRRFEKEKKQTRTGRIMASFVFIFFTGDHGDTRERSYRKHKHTPLCLRRTATGWTMDDTNIWFMIMTTHLRRSACSFWPFSQMDSP
ncbi:hypothetical protein BJV74DRAFT_850184 [Russula compacta]|nr:hypothetical protein BJV74DRAFT_850184 [Russula compacta]